ncbi:MAG: hypothetical protein KF726_04615 [Anaerolineae bacterium]|nr:hypothetical protein [Anaerolineae bacterium]
MSSNELKFSDEARRAMQLSEDIAREFAHATVEPGHLLIALRITGGAPSLALQDMQITLDLLKALVHTEYRGVVKQRVALQKLELSTGIKQALQNAVNYARRWNHSRIGTTHLMLGLIQFQDVTITRLLEWTALHPSELSDFVLDRVKTGTPPADYFGELPDEPKGIFWRCLPSTTTRHRQPRTILVMTPPSPPPSVLNANCVVPAILRADDLLKWQPMGYAGTTIQRSGRCTREGRRY